MAWHWPFLLCTLIALQSENNTAQKMLPTMVTMQSLNLIHQNSPNTVVPTIPVSHHPWHYQDKVPWPSDCPAIMSFWKKITHYHRNAWSAQVSKLGRTGKKSRTIFDHATTGFSLIPPPFKVRSIERIFGWTRRWVHCIFPIFIQKWHEIITLFHAIFFDAATHNDQLEKMGKSSQ